MKKQHHLKTIITSISIALISNIGMAGEPLGGDITYVLKNATNPLIALSIIERRINEWSIGVFNPDYVPLYPQQDYDSKYSNYEFKNLVSFGDSLNDRGAQTRSTLFLAGGYDKKLYSDYLSEHYTGKESIPYTYGGMNYSEAGATVKNRGSSLFLRTQIDRYLANRDGIADSDSLYLISAGGMDVNDQIVGIAAGYLNGSYNSTDPYYTIDDSPKLLAEDVTYLRDHGAKYIVVSNVPDASLTPYSQMVPVEFISTILDKLYLPNFGLITHVGKLIDNFLRNPANQLPGTGKDLIRNNGIRTFQSFLWFLPSSVTTSFYDSIVDILRTPTEQFNNSLELELSNIGGDVVFVDFHKLISEVIDDYQSYGFGEILVPTCDLGFSSRYCDYNSDRYHKDKAYLYSDWFHPSPETHFLINQYIQSVFDAPLYVSTISEHFSSLNRAKNNFLEGQLFNIKNQLDKTTGYWNLIIGYEGLMNDKNYQTYRLDGKKTYANTLNVGFYTFTNPQTALGVLFSTSFGKQKPFDNYNFRTFSETVTLFSEWNNDKGYWVNSQLDFGYLKAKDIHREIQLGDLRRTENSSSVNAYSYGIKVLGGYDWITNDTVQSGPQAGLNISRFSVKSFREKDDNSTSMKFDSHHKNDFYATVGWYVNTNNNFKLDQYPASLKAEINYNQTIGNEDTKIRGGLNSTLTSFTRELDNSKHWVDVKLNANIKLSDTSTLSANTAYSFGNKKNKQLSYGLGYSYKF